MLLFTANAAVATPPPHSLLPPLGDLLVVTGSAVVGSEQEIASFRRLLSDKLNLQHNK